MKKDFVRSSSDLFEDPVLTLVWRDSGTQYANPSWKLRRIVAL
jgi:hypothetical protein